MSLRETVNKNPKQTAIFAGVAILLCVGLLAWQSMGGGTGSAGPLQAYYTVDDGKSWFAADATQSSPFTHEGKPAYRVHVFKCGPNGTPFAGYLERLTDAARKQAEALKAKHASDPFSPELEGVVATGAEVKKPGDAKWVRANAKGAAALRTPACPSGQSGAVVEVSP